MSLLGRDKGHEGIEGLVLFAANTGAALAKVKHVCTALNCSRNGNWRQTVHFMTRMYLVVCFFFKYLLWQNILKKVCTVASKLQSKTSRAYLKPRESLNKPEWEHSGESWKQSITRTNLETGQQWRVSRLAALVKGNTATQSLKVRKSLTQASHAGEDGVLESPRKPEKEGSWG